MSIKYSLQVDKKAKELELTKLNNQKKEIILKKFEIKSQIQALNVEILRINEQVSDVKLCLSQIQTKINNGDTHWLKKWEK